MLLAGAGMTTAGAVALGVADGDGWVTTPTARVSTDTAALVGTDIDVDLGQAIDDRTFFSFDGIPTAVEVASRNGQGRVRRDRAGGRRAELPRHR